MLTAFGRAFKTPDLRRKILFTLLILAVFRLGSTIPTPNVNIVNVDSCRAQATSGDAAGLYSMIQLFSGGALSRFSIFALGIMPYITASIILQLLVVVSPALEKLQNIYPHDDSEKLSEEMEHELTEQAMHEAAAVAKQNAKALQAGADDEAPDSEPPSEPGGSPSSVPGAPPSEPGAPPSSKPGEDDDEPIPSTQRPETLGSKRRRAR